MAGSGVNRDVDGGFELLLRSLLDSVNAAVIRGDISEALRLADAAARRAPEAPEILEILGRLSLRATRYDEAVTAFRTALESRSDPKLSAALVEALVEANGLDEGREALVSALGQFAVDPGTPLAESARTLTLALPTATAGWIALSSDLEVWGEVWHAQDGQPSSLTLKGVENVRLEAMPGDEIRPLYRFTGRPLGDHAGPIEAYFDGQPLVGSGLQYPPAFCIDGRSLREGDEISGWVSVGWSPRRLPEVLVRDEDGLERIAEVVPSPTEFGQYFYRLGLKRSDLTACEMTVIVKVGDDVREALPDSPVLLKPPPPWPSQVSRAKKGVRSGRPSPIRRRRRPIDVVIPAYRGLAETLACIESVRRTVGPTVTIVVIDDATPEPALALALDGLDQRGDIQLLRSPSNQGFPAAVNLGLDLNAGHDVVILNSDTQVFAGWLERLRNAAYSADDIGTVTPLTNSGSIASYPAVEATVEPGHAARISEFAAQVNSGLVVDTPTGVGFCMFVRRDCLDAAGTLDASAFSKGYGEENDFCLRASDLGWRHVIAPDVFVAHLGGLSFGGRRDALLERNLKILNRRYPGYDDDVRQFDRQDPLRLARRRIAEAELTAVPSRFVMMVTLALPGGVERFVRERVEEWQSRDVGVLVLSPDKECEGLRISVFGAPDLPDLVYADAEDYAALEVLLHGLEIDGCEFHHFLGLDPMAVDAILAASGPYDIYIHDYSWLCTHVTMLTSSARFCHEAPLSACRTCALDHSARLEPGLTIDELRQRSDRWLLGARTVVTPSIDTRDRLRRYFPGIDPEVRPWEPAVPSVRHQAAGAEIVKVAVIGAIGEHKGYNVLKACAEDAERRGLPLEFVIIGFTEDDPTLFDTGRIFITGRYAESELEQLIAREAPDVAFFASVWPETWCFALTYALRAGLPTLAFEMGAIAERLSASDCKHALLDPNTSIEAINDQLIAMAREGSQGDPPQVETAANPPREARSLVPAVDARALAPIEPIQPSNAKSSRQIMDSDKRQISVSGELIPLSKGLYQVSVRSASPNRAGNDGDIMIPAIHVGVGPGVPAENIELMTGVYNQGAWLYAERDELIIKVNATPTTVLLTTVSAEGKTPLQINLERLDGRKAQPPARQPQQNAGLAAQAPQALPTLPAHMPARVAEAQAAEAGGRGLQPGQAGPHELRTQILVHVQTKGDMTFTDSFWAGALGERLAIEAFAIAPLEGIAAHQLEYKALLATGAETGWVNGGDLCGARGRTTPILGFAVRLKGGAETRFDCEYRGAFGSGKIAGPLTNGAPCRATVSGDFLEGIQLSIVERGAAKGRNLKPAEGGAAPKANKPGAKFSAFREDVS